MEKEAKEKRSCLKLTRIENLTRGLLAGNNQEDMFLVSEVEGKGRGVFLKAPVLPKDSFVLEYEGDIISSAEADIREQFYCSNDEGCFIMYFTFKGTKMAVDATRTFSSFGRLVNHSRHPNIRFHKPLVIDLNSGMPRIAAYALRDIKQGEEIVMDYGIRNGDIPWLKNTKPGFLANVDVDPGLADDSGDDSNSDSIKVSSKVSPVKSSSTEKTACDNLNKIQNVDVLPAVVDVGTKKKTMKIDGFCMVKFVPNGRKKSYFAAYEIFGEPEEIKRFSDEPPKKTRNSESHKDSSVISCCKQFSIELCSMKSGSSKLSCERELSREKCQNELSSVKPDSTFLSSEKEAHNNELYSVELDSKEAHCNNMKSDIYKKESVRDRLRGKNHSNSNKLLDKRHSDSFNSFHVQSLPVDITGNRSEEFNNKFEEKENLVASVKSEPNIEINLPLHQSSISLNETAATKSAMDSRVDKHQNSVSLNETAATKPAMDSRVGKHQNSISLNETAATKPAMDSRVDKHQNSISLNETAAAKFAMDSRVDKHQNSISLNETARTNFAMDSRYEKWKEAILCEISNVLVSEDSLLDKTLTWTTEIDAANEICRIQTSSDCDIGLPEEAGLCIQSGMLSKNLQNCGPVKCFPVSPQVAVIKPYNPMCMLDQTYHLEDLPDAKEETQKVSAALTESESEHLKSLFEQYQERDKLLTNDVLKIVNEHKEFLVKLISRGITTDQITSTVRQFFLKTA